MSNSEKQKSATGLKEFFKQWPTLYYFVYDYLGPLYFGGLSATNFLKKHNVETPCYNLGSGTRIIKKEITNVDIAKYDTVDVVADITDLPIKDGEAGSVICEEVFEHVRKPQKAVSEIYRILKPGGYAYITVPFLYPYHASPDDYTRWTHVGFKKLLSRFEIVELGIRSGPFSTFTVNTAYFFATLLSFGSERLYWFLVLFFSIIFSPFKFLDIFGNRLPNAINMSALLYCVVRKKDEK